MLVPGNVDDGIVRADCVECFIFEWHVRQVCANESGIPYVCFGHAELLLGKVNSGNGKWLCKESRYRTARSASRIEYHCFFRQPLYEKIQELDIFGIRISSSRSCVSCCDLVVAFSHNLLGGSLVVHTHHQWCSTG